MHGSRGLAQTLIEHDLVDEYRLVYFPLHVGSGKKLFRDGTRPRPETCGTADLFPVSRRVLIVRAWLSDGSAVRS